MGTPESFWLHCAEKHHRNWQRFKTPARRARAETAMWLMLFAWSGMLFNRVKER